MKVLTLTGKAARLAACRYVMDAAEGLVFMITEPKRSAEQNALMWPLLECFSEQLAWQINGADVMMEPEEWKDVLSAGFDNEEVRLARGLNGGLVMLGKRTSQFGKKRFSAFIEFILAEGATRGVSFERQRQREAA